MSMPMIVGIIVVAVLCAWGLVELVGKSMENDKKTRAPAKAAAKSTKRRAAPARRRAKAR